MITRRDCLKGGAAAAALAASGCLPVAESLHEPIDEWLPASARTGEARHLEAAVRRTLDRAGYGPRPGDLERVREIGLDAYLEEQLHPESVEETPALAWRLWRLDTLQADTDLRYEFPKEQARMELQQAAVLRARYSRRQLQEAMVEFWTDHFNISQLKGDGAFLKSSDDEAVIRRHALGRFRDLLWASATSPAMLHYLDNARNTRAAGNENYARELMELHTLGVHGGYTQQDVQEVARSFTGWSYEGEGSWQRGRFAFRPDEHDDGPRRVLGVILPGGLGRGHGERVLEILAEHPATGRFLARKLCRRFVADEGAIPGALVARLAGVFVRTRGDIRQVLSVLFRTDEFRYGTACKLKRPFDFVISAMRALNADTDGRGALPYLRRMGHVPFQWAMPNGYPDHVQVWLPSLLGRWSFAVDLVSGRIPGTWVDLAEVTRAAGAHRPDAQVRALAAVILGGRAPARWGRSPREVPQLRRVGCSTPRGIEALDRASRGLGARRDLEEAAALLLMSPAFQWR